MEPSKKIIINADDFGLSSAINSAIMKCFDKGLISSTTIMANMPGFEEACLLAKQNNLEPNIGVHINLSEGPALTAEIRKIPGFCDHQGHFNRSWSRRRLFSLRERTAIACEVREQIKRCRLHGLSLTHADSHHHVHTVPGILIAIASLLKTEGISRLRISRNSDFMPARLRILKAAFNLYLVGRGFKCTNYFGDLASYGRFSTRKENFSSFEIMVHPAIDQFGKLIDSRLNCDLSPALLNLDKEAFIIPYSEFETVDDRQ